MLQKFKRKNILDHWSFDDRSPTFWERLKDIDWNGKRRTKSRNWAVLVGALIISLWQGHWSSSNWLSIVVATRKQQNFGKGYFQKKKKGQQCHFTIFPNICKFHISPLKLTWYYWNSAPDSSFKYFQGVLLSFSI